MTQIRYFEQSGGYYPIFITKDSGEELRIGAASNYWGSVTLRKEFDQLNPQEQQEVIRQIKEKVITPEQCAEINWQKTEKDSNITDLRQDLTILKTSGTTLEHSSNVYDRHATSGYSPDERRGPVSYTKQVRVHKLLIKDKKLETIGSFRFYGSPDNLEEVKQGLLSEKEATLKMLLSQREKVTNPSLDPRIHEDLSPEEWSQRYKERFDALFQEALSRWEAEDQAARGEQELKIQEYQNAVEVLKELVLQAEEKKEEIKKKAHFTDHPQFPYTDFRSLDMIIFFIDRIKKYLADCDQAILEAEKKEKELEPEPELPSSEPNEPVEPDPEPEPKTYQPPKEALSFNALQAAFGGAAKMDRKPRKKRGKKNRRR